MLIMRFIHFLGMCLWIGGMVAAMVVVVNTRSEHGAAKRMGLRLVGKLYSLVIGPGTFLTVLMGLFLTMSLAQRSASAVMARPGIWVMQVTGLLAGVLVLFVGLPTAMNLARIASASDDGELPSLAARLQKRLSIVAHVSAVLIMVALYFAVVVQ